ncbi:serine/threonine protein kinase [Deinococcus arenae]|uniref:non-specific serine/threonine protein kinase n=1 Tax=Deinococcus arenae TaxID=1452751 RepID=A0A8H9GKI9_9DEIO|nr:MULTISPECIES: protein kinase [Deinococcus]AWT35390.1 6-bladed beta-propeller [Deinococcus actinosclerus]GGM35246.1 serine/threonine protein kinase [Deinococcus arenae]
MTPVLLTALFVVGVLLSVRVGERILSSVLAVVVGLLVALLGALALGLGRPDDGGLRLADLGRAQGALVVAAFLIATAAFHMGRMLLPSLDRPGRKPVKVQRTASPTQVQRRTSLTQTQVTHDLRFQEYEVLDRIGVGGMGSVYRARRRQDGRTVALKVPQDKYLADAKFVKRFYREAEVLKRFNHPNIVRVYDYRMQDPEHYIAMEFLDGESLEDLLENRTLTFTESTQIIRALADALRHIHMQNVVHRDIKPANVMVLKNAFADGQLRDGGVKLMDFGIAVGKVLTRLTMTGARVGTPIYMAPEQAKGNRVDARSDVYSLGLLAYEMVTGQTAFKGSYEAVVHQQVFESPKPPKQVRLEVPGKLNDLILNMIEKDPASRPTLDDVIARVDAGVLSDDVFNDPVALALSVQEKRGTLRLLDLKGKLRASLRDQTGGALGLPGAPNAMASDPEGHLFVTLLDYRQGQRGAMVRKLDPEGKELLSFGPYGLGDGELLQPVGVAVARGLVHVLDAEAQHVVTYDLNGQFIRRFGGRGQGQGRFEKPRSIVAAPDGHVYVLDTGTNEVQRFSAQGEYLSRFAFRLDRNSDALRPLEGLGVDQFGAVYIVDSVARKVRKIEADGTPGLTFSMETLVGEPTDAPWLIQVSPEGQMYAVRQGGQVLRTYSSVGDLLSSNDMYAPVQAMSLLQRPHVLQPA